MEIGEKFIYDFKSIAWIYKKISRVSAGFDLSIFGNTFQCPHCGCSNCNNGLIFFLGIFYAATSAAAALASVIATFLKLEVD